MCRMTDNLIMTCTGNVAPKSSVWEGEGGSGEMWVQRDLTVNLKPKNQKAKYQEGIVP